VISVPRNRKRLLARGGRPAGALAILATVLVCAGLAAGAAAAAAPTVVLTVSPNPAQPGDSVTLTATITGAPVGGAVWFVDGATQLTASRTNVPAGDSQVTFSTSFSVGSHALTAVFRDNGFNTTTSAPVTLVVGSAITPVNTTVSLTLTPATIAPGQQVTLTATVTQSGATGIPTGGVAFYDNGQALAPGGSQVALDAHGVATYVASGFAAGSHTISASYSGDALDNPSSTSTTTTVTAPPTAVATTTTVTVSPTRIVAGASVTLSAHVVQVGHPTSPPAGQLVTFTANGTWVAEAQLDANGNAVATGVVGWIDGSYDIKALYVGDVNNLTSSGHIPLTVLANPIPLTITAPSASIVYGGAVPPVSTPTYAGFASGDSIATLDAPATCSTTAATGSAAGTYPVTCSGAASGIYAFTYVDGSVSIAPAALRVTPVNASITVGDPLPTLTATVTGFVNGETLATSGVTGSPSCTTTATASSPAGTYPITCTIGTLAATNYVFTFAPAGTLTISPAAPPVTCTSTKSHDDDSDTHGRRDGHTSSPCESLLADPSTDGLSPVSPGQKLSIVYLDDTPIAGGALAPTALLSTGQLLPVTVTPTSRQKKHYVDDNGGSMSDRYQSLLSFTLPSGLAPGRYSILVTVNDSDGHMDQWIWQIRVGKSSGHDDGGDDGRDWQSVFDRLAATLHLFGR
jgi:hypothetical protein